MADIAQSCWQYIISALFWGEARKCFLSNAHASFANSLESVRTHTEGSMRVKDRVALVTGAGAGIGRATALLLAREGARVGLADLDVRSGEEATQTIRETDSEAIFIQSNVTSETDCARMVSTVVERWGRLNILCNIAGVVLGGILDQTEEKDWNASLDVNLRSIYLVSKYAIPQMKKAGGGSIVNMASVAGLMGVKNRAAYSASKGGVIALTKSMAIDYAEDNIRVNSVCPGTVDTPSLQRRLNSLPDPAGARRDFIARQPMKRFGGAEEIAYAVLFLCSEESSFVTGTELIVDGGMSL
jgi:meso-butanediol dehydrogenase / (S,S)-butanediol dehydrogenase / diacetyl reductase